MLYTAVMKPNVPNELWLGQKEYSAWTDWKVNGWLFVATLMSGASDIMFPHVVKGWAVPLRGLVALAPFLALMLWMRNLARWIRGMDELHRRITLAAVLCAVSASFFLVVLWHRLDQAGVFQALFPSTRPSEVSWDIVTVGHIFLLMTCCYFFSYRLCNRRYQ